MDRVNSECPRPQNLAASQHALIWDMIIEKAFTYHQIAEVISYSPDSVKARSANLWRFGALALRQHYCTTLIVVAALHP
jgi:hypothetical protein